MHRALDHAVAPEQLRWTCDPATLPFETTESVAPRADAIGQERALSALALGLEMRGDTFNVFVAGVAGTGRSSTAVAAATRVASKRPPPGDWCYVFNFDDPGRPLAIGLPAGTARELGGDMDRLVERLRQELVGAYQSREYRRLREQAHKPVEESRDRLLREMTDRATREGFVLSVSPVGATLMPTMQERPITADQLARMSDEERQQIRERTERLSEVIRDGFAHVERLEREAHARMADHDRQVAEDVVGPEVQEYITKYRDRPRVVEYLERVRRDVVEHADAIRQSLSQQAAEDTQPPPVRALLAEIEGDGASGLFDRYRVNVLIEHRDRHAAPVVTESHPTYYNLLGRVEYRARLGSMVTDFRLIKPGALHRANGGFLVLNALDVLSNPWAWEVLKRSLKTREIRIENLGEQFTAIPAATIRPDPIPLDIKVVLIGPPPLYYLLYFLDEDFGRLFRIRADFDTEMQRTDEHLARYWAFVSHTVHDCGLRHFDRSAVARVAEFGARVAEHQHRLTARVRQVADVVCEASHWAEQDGSRYVMAQHVDRAIGQRRYRSNLVEEKLQQLVDEGAILLDVTGSRVGQVNALSVLVVGEYAFGRPVRLTAQTGLGGEGLVNLERETKLSGRIHNKAFLTLTSFLLGRYAQDQPLALSARITFEQTYDEVEGDSASSAELYALLSSLSGLPIRQDIAVTGSVNQLGEVQAVGGVTFKVEGFFDLCRRRGLTGEQGVIVPASAVKYLMLRDEVVEAVRQGRFHVWAVSSIDEGIEILTGVAAGRRLPNGRWEEGSVNARIERRLHQYAERLKAFTHMPERAEIHERPPADVGPRTPRLRRGHRGRPHDV